jgi:hypothetical protein
MEDTMKPGNSPKLTLMSLIAVMTLSSGCASDDLQRFRETMVVSLETAQKTMNSMRQGAELAECMKKNSCQRNIDDGK